MKRKILLAAAAIIAASAPVNADNLVILHTNDTHSQIDPTADNLGGVMRRKAVIDSVRSADPNVLLVDAGDIVQGTLYFNLYRGDVEYKVMNQLGYDLQVLGNHEFDNGIDELADHLRDAKGTYITTNYDIDGTPLEGLLVPYVVKNFNGKKVGFFGLNLDPKGMISGRNIPGVKYIDPYEAAEHTAWALRHNEKADYVVALSHLSYSDPVRANDSILALTSRNIDLIIGGHTHTPLNPDDPASLPTVLKNADGKDVTIAQLLNTGTTIGKIDLDLDNGKIKSSVIPLDSRYDGRADADLQALIEPYKSKVDSLLSLKIAKSAAPLDKQSIINIFSDLTLRRGRELTKEPVALAVLNNGGIRNTLPKGQISEGEIMMVLPFNNIIEVVKIKGSDLAEAFAQMGQRPINGVSSNVDILYNPATKQCDSITIDGKPLDPDAVYNIATIDYLAEGGDYISALTKGNVIATSGNIMSADIIKALKKQRKPLRPDTKERLHQ